MSRRSRLTPSDGERIRALSDLGMPPAEICRTVGRSRWSVGRVLAGERCTTMWLEPHALARNAQAALATSSALRLAPRIKSPAVVTEGDQMSKIQTIRERFTEVVLEHFKSGRRPSERMLADLERELAEDGYTEPVLDRAVRDMLRTRWTKSFPSVAECLAACRVAQDTLRSELNSAGTDGHELNAKGGRA